MKIIISHVVALSNNNVIGKDNKLPWNLRTDLKHFKEYTTNKIILMGRKTFESIGKPLPNRLNFIVSTKITDIEGARVFKSTQNGINAAMSICNEDKQYNEIVIIGGGYLFRETLQITNKLVLTKVDCEIEGDVFYPDVDLIEWREKSTKSFVKDSNNDYDFVVKEYERF